MKGMSTQVEPSRCIGFGKTTSRVTLPAFPLISSSLAALCKSCTCLHLFVLKTFRNQNMNEKKLKAALPALHALPALPYFPAILPLRPHLLLCAKAVLCLHLFMLKTFRNQKMKKRQIEGDECAVVKK